MQKLQDKSIQILIFLGIFGFSLGLFNNYRDLWLASNSLKPETISKVISIASIVTVLILFFFTIKVTQNKLKQGITISLILKMLTSAILIVLNNTQKLFLIKFFMFFDIALTQVILSSIYPLMMSIAKNDLLYTKRSVVESLMNKLGFLLISIFLGKTIGHLTIDYNISFIISTIFVFIAFIVFLNIDVSSTKESKEIEIKETYRYFKQNKLFLLYLISNLIGSIIWAIILGMPLLTLTKVLSFSPNNASFLVLGLGILSNILAILIIKYFRFKNDHFNLIFKYGLRVIIYFMMFIINSKKLLLLACIYLLLTDAPYGFIIDSHFINKIEEKYSMVLVIFKYCANLIGDGIGVFICGMLFAYPVKYIGLAAFSISIIHYIIASILINKKCLV